MVIGGVGYCECSSGRARALLIRQKKLTAIVLSSVPPFASTNDAGPLGSQAVHNYL